MPVELSADGVTLDIGRPRFGPSLERKETADALRVGVATLEES